MWNKIIILYSLYRNPCPFGFSTNPCECSKTHLVPEMGITHRDFWLFCKVWKKEKKGLLLVLFGHFNSLWKQSLPLRVLVRDWYIAIHQKNHLYCPLQEHHAGPRKKSTTIWRCILVRCTMSKLRSIRFEGK